MGSHSNRHQVVHGLGGLGLQLDRRNGTATPCDRLENYKIFHMRLKTKAAKGLIKPCGAHARTTGQPCRCLKVYRGGRCKFHGGLSTGPRTVEGKARALRAMREGWRRWRDTKRAR